MSGSINDIDTVLGILSLFTTPETGGRSRRNRDAAFLLLLHPVHGGCAVVSFTDFVRSTRIVQNALRCRRFTGVNMRHNADITGMLQ